MLSQLHALATPLPVGPDSLGLHTSPGATLSSWQAAALAAYSEQMRLGELGAELAVRVRDLTGCAVPDAAIAVDHSARRATTAIDGVIFQLRGRDLIVLRPCIHCGVGLFASPTIASSADLGHALSGWQPYHDGCAPADPVDMD